LLSGSGFGDVFFSNRVTDDSTLLRRYAEDRDEAAFAEVVRRNLPFVYSAALRRLSGDAHRAHDVAQVVFCALARHAHRVSRQPVLGGWLYTATRNAVIGTVRTEKRRRTREEEACQMQQIESEPNAPGDWSKLRPVLDSAMDRLSARDREAVLLRFFQNRSFREIGAAVGLSEDAARKRIDRALARLRDVLRPHGIGSTSALATLLGSQSVSAAPASLLASVTGAALSTGSAAVTGIATFITMTKLQAGIVAAVFIAGGVGLATQQRTISRLRQEAALAQERLIRPANEGATSAKTRGSVGAALANARSRTMALDADATLPSAMARGEILAETSAALQHGKVPERHFAFMTVLQKLSRDNWREVLEAFQDERKRTGLGHPEMYDIFERRAGEVAGKDAVGYFLEIGWGGAANEAMIGWAAKNPVEALQWLGHEADSETRRNVMGAAIRGLALTEPDLAVKTLEEQPVKERDRYADEIVTTTLRSVGIDGAQRLVEGMITRAAAAGSLKADYIKHVFHDYSSLRIFQSAANGTISDTITWLNQHVGQPYVDHRVIASATERLATQNPLETFRWLENVNTALLRAGDESTAGYRVLLDAWAKKEGAPVVENWLQSKTSHPHYDHIAYQYVALVAAQDSKKATHWADSIKDTNIKKNAVILISQKAPKKKS
jgi:RNA polymerase sigma factor (sigma-70 family)